MIRWCNYDFRVDSETQILEDKRQTQQSDYKQMLLLIRLACTFKAMNDIFTPIGYIVVRSHRYTCIHHRAFSSIAAIA